MLTCSVLQLGTVYQLIITLSILISQVLGMNNVLGTEEGWPWLLALTAVPAILQTAPFHAFTTPIHHFLEPLVFPPDVLFGVIH